MSKTINQPWSTPVSKFVKTVMVDLKIKFPKLKQIKEHHGRFTKDDLKRYAVATPALFVTVVKHQRNAGDSGCDNAQERDYVVVFTVVCKDIPLQSKESLALAISSEVSKYIDKEASWGVFISPSESVNLSNSATDARDVSLWGISFIQTLEI